MSYRYIVYSLLKKCLAPQISNVSLSYRPIFVSSCMLKKCSTWMEGSLSVCMVVISRVGIISAVGELEVAISKSLRVRV